MNKIINTGLIVQKAPAIVTASIAALLGFAPLSGLAATRIKQNNTTDLNLAGSWDTLPGAVDIAQWDSSVTSANSSVLGANLTWGGIKVIAPGGEVTIGAGSTLTVGSSGIDLSSATQNLTLNSGLMLQGQQSWKAAVGRTLKVAGAFTRGSAVVDFTNFNAAATLSGVVNDTTGMLGTWATTGSLTTLNYVKNTGGLLSAYTTQTAATVGSLANVTGATANYSFAAAATLSGSITANTLRYVGVSATLANAGFTTTLNGLMNAGSAGGLVLSGAGNLEIGANKELVVIASKDITIAAKIVDNPSGPSSLTYSGSNANLNLSGANTYSGGTVINSGTLYMGIQVNGAIGTGPVRINSGGALGLQRISITRDLTLNGGMLSGGGGWNDVNVAGTIALTANSTFDFTDVYSTINSTVSGVGGLTKIGAGLLKFNGMNTYTGPTVVNTGVLQFKNSLYGNDSLQWTPANITVGNGATLLLSVGGVSDFTATQAGTLFSGLSVVNNNGLKSGSFIGFDTGSASSLVTIAGNLANSVGVGSGAVGLKKYGSTVLELTGMNTYAGQTILDSGGLKISSFNNVVGSSTSSSLGAPTTVSTGTIVMGNGGSNNDVTLIYSGSGETTDRVLNFVSQSAKMTLDQSGSGLLKFTTALAINSGYVKNLTLQGSTAGTAEISGNIPAHSTLSVTKSGTSTWTLSGSNAYAGTTSVNAGILVCSSAASLGNGPLNINSGAKLALNYDGTRQVSSLKYNSGAAQANGTYGSMASTATFKNDTYFVGTGTVTVGPLATVTTSTLAVTGGNNPSVVNTALTVTATVSGTTPTGSMSFYDGATLLGSSFLNGLSQASFTTSGLTLGAHNITAKYQSDLNNQVSISAALAIQVVGATNILSFDFAGLPSTTISGTAISVTVPYLTVVTALVPTYTMSAGATGIPASGLAGDFSTPQTYTVTAPDLSSQSYTVTVNKLPASSAKNILTFALAGSVSTNISGTNISVNVPYGTSLTNFTPIYTISPFATVTPGSGSSQNFTTPQTYTVTAQDGSTQDYLVTVIVNSSVFTWKTAVAGNWSDPLKWSNNQADGTAPGATGQADYILNFSQAGTYTVTNDRNSGFLLNQLNLGGAVTVAGNNLVFIGNGVTLPQINQNSTSSVVINSPVGLTSNLTLGGSNTGNVDIKSNITGVGSLTKSVGGILILNGVNTYTGGTVVNAGTLYCSGDLSLGSHIPNNTSALGAAGSVNVTIQNGATLALNRNQITGNLTLNGGKVATGNGWGDDAWNGSIVLGATSTVDVGSKDGCFIINAVVSGPGGLIKLGVSNRAMPLSGANLFKGNVSVQAGALQVSSLNRIVGGTATSNLGAPTTVADGTIALGFGTNNATLFYTGAGETTDRVIKLAGATGGATLSQMGASVGIPTPRGESGLLKFTSDVSIPGVAGVDNRKTLTLNQVNSDAYGANSGRGEISGSIGDSLVGAVGKLATSVTKGGVGIWTLSGNNSYSGATKVEAGTLIFTRILALGSGPLDISTGAKVQLDYIGTRQISALTFNAGLAQANGSYGSSSSLATFKDDTRFSGLGTVTVGSILLPSTVSLVRNVGSEPANGGDSLTFTATVSGNSPTGNIEFYDGLTLISRIALNGSSQAVVTTSDLSPGTHDITALYLGNPGNASSSVILTQTVAETRLLATTTTLSLTSGVNPSAYGTAVTFTASVVGSIPSGSVVFYNGTTPLGVVALNGLGQASFSTSGLGVGWRGIIARYQGDATHQPSRTLVPLFQNVNPLPGNGKLKVFILAGQSNMVGKGSVEKGRNPNNFADTTLVGGLGSLRNMLNKNPDKYNYLADPANPTPQGNPGWLKRSDVWVTYTGDTTRSGILDADFGNLGGQGLIGPEYGFGLVAANQFADPVLVIKIAWGGKSLIADFRPPSSGGTVGPYYTSMINRVHEVLNNLPAAYPGYNGGGYDLVGFGWHQGWNDLGEATSVYEGNLTNLIKDVRTEFNTPNLLFSVAATGMANGAGGTVLVAQMNVGNPTLHPDFAGNVASVDTRPFDYGVSLGASSEGYHWNWNGESYFNIGESMGLAMMAMLPAKSSAKNILSFDFPGLPATTISGTNINVTVPAGTNVTALAPIFTWSPLATASLPSGTARNFSTPLSYTITAEDLTTQVYTITVTVAGGSFTTWASDPAQGLTVGVNDGIADDPDHDGISNLMEFALGGAPMVASRAILPALTKSGSNWLFEYERSDQSLASSMTQVVEYGNDLSGWTAVTIPPTSAGIVTITPSTPSDHVVVSVPNQGAKTFVRLKVTP